MKPSSVEDDNEIEVVFVDDRAVVHIIQDEEIQKNRSKNKSETPLRSQKTPKTSKTSVKSKKTPTLDDDHSSDGECSGNNSNFTLKPRALFEDGDVPGERMFSFNSKQKTTSSNQLSSQKTPKSKKESSKNKAICHPQVLFEDDSENESNTVNKKSTRTSKQATPTVKNESLNNGSQVMTANKYGYETPKKFKNAHNSNGSEGILNHILTPKTSRSEKYINSEKALAKTPRVVRKQIAKGIAYQKLEELNELNDSDYSASDDSDKSDESESDSSTHSRVKPVVPKEINTNVVSLRRSTRKKEVPFMYKSEEYFLSKSTKSMKKSKTSDNSLKLLKNPSLDQRQVDQLSKNSNLTHNKKLKALYQETVSNFPYWLCLLNEGFNLLLYGFGSKRQIINDFRLSLLESENVLVVNGFFPGLTLKEILESITLGMLELDSCPGSVELAIQQIEEEQKLKNAEHLFILIHNLDGVELQNYKTQHALSRICSLKNVHLIASIDRVNAALMFDNTKLGDYNFIWMDCTNYVPYTIETKFMESLMVKNTGSTHALSGLNNFFKSLTSNAKRILLLLIKDCIENKSNKKYGGVPFSILYRWCRQRFLVSTDLALRSQLVEFVDHELIKWKRDADILYVSVDVDVLVQFYKQNSEDDD